MNLYELNHVIEECSVCFAQVKAMNFSAHTDWHKAQAEVMEGTVRILERITGDVYGLE